jgi:hypothetical protein
VRREWSRKERERGGGAAPKRAMREVWEVTLVER